MAVEVKMPRYGANMEEGLIGEWLVTEGEQVTKDQGLFTVEIEKLTNEVTSPVDGVVRRILFEAEETVSCAETVCIIAAADEQAAEPQPKEQPALTNTAESIEDPQKGYEKPREAVNRPVTVETERIPKGRRAITPKAQVLAKELKVAYQDIPGTGLHGMITREDIRRAAAGESTEVSARGAAPALRTQLKGARKVIAQRMSESLSSAAQSALWMDADVTDMMHSYQKGKEAYHRQGIRISVTALILGSIAQVIARHPICRTQIDADGNLLLQSRINIAVAVDTPAGLMVPVIRDCDLKSTAEIAQELAVLADRARIGTLDASDMAEHVMTLSNLGTYGVTYSRPILNLPESVILGTGAITKRPVYMGDGLFARDILPLSLSFDHRIVDGGPAAAFLKDICVTLGVDRLAELQ
jgi:pyruvate dehydrogenase E2 component (dihydrolipoamide acetyltransferase)